MLNTALKASWPCWGEGLPQKAPTAIVHGVPPARAGSLHGCRDIFWDERLRSQPRQCCAGGSLERKQHQWAFLQANIGLYSGHFARHLASGSSCQAQPKRWLSEEIPPESSQPEQELQVEAESSQPEQELQVEPKRKQAEPVPEGPKEGEELVAPPASSIFLDDPLSAVEQEMVERIAFTGEALCGFQVPGAMGSWQQVQLFALLP